MLNISDIRERLERNPEPKEIKDIRDNILNAFKKLEFVEEGHKYFVHNGDGTIMELPSVSKICGQFSEEVDWDTIAENKAIKDGIPLETLKRQWRERNLKSTSNGTKTHLFGEAMMYFIRDKVDLMPEEIRKYQYEDGFMIPYGKKEEAIMNFFEDIIKCDNIYPILAEAQIYTGINDVLKLKQNYSGTFDMLFGYRTKNGRFKLLIYDYKTNVSLTNQYNRNNNRCMLKPFSDMVEEAKSHYTIQLSAYQLGLMQLGYEIADRKLIWLKDDGTYDKIQVDDVTELLKTELKKDKLIV